MPPTEPGPVPSSHPIPGTGIAFVAGATGYVGRHVVRACRDAGLVTRAHVRPDSRSLKEWQKRFTAIGATVDCSPWTEAAITAALARLAPTHVFALLGTTRARAARGDSGSAVRESYEAVDYGLSAMLLRASIACMSRPVFIYLSALGASETARGEYQRVRGRVEREVLDSGLPSLIARPSFITGDDRDESRPAERVGARLLDGVAGLATAIGAGDAAARWQSMTGDELGAALVRHALAVRAGSVTLDAAQLRRPAVRSGSPVLSPAREDVR